VCLRLIRKIPIQCMRVVRAGSLQLALRNDVMIGVRHAAVPAGKQPDQAEPRRDSRTTDGCGSALNDFANGIESNLGRRSKLSLDEFRPSRGDDIAGQSAVINR
jgi:hypothetical protein